MSKNYKRERKFILRIFRRFHSKRGRSSFLVVEESAGKVGNAANDGDKLFYERHEQTTTCLSLKVCVRVKSVHATASNRNKRERKRRRFRFLEKSLLRTRPSYVHTSPATITRRGSKRDVGYKRGNGTREKRNVDA